MTIVRVALDVPLDKLFDYRCDESQPPSRGAMIAVPFGARRMVGVALEFARTSAVEPAKIRSVHKILHDVPALSHATLELLGFCSRYYHHPLGQTIHTALPSALKQLIRRQDQKPQAYTITDAGDQCDLDALPRNAVVQRALLDLFKRERHVTREQILAVSANAGKALRLFLDARWVEATEPKANVSNARRDEAPLTARSAVELTPEQSEAVDRVRRSLGTFRCHVLRGVTGSGKTEVYLSLIDHAIAAGKQALLLVPEINLTPQLEDALAARFGEQRVITLHSAIADGERLERWKRAARGSVDIVAGTRLAVFAQLPRLGLVIVDEEHDASYKQQEGLRYSARDVAVALAKQRGVPVLLGSATPSLETMRQAYVGRYDLCELTQRASGLPPSIELVPLAKQKRTDSLSDTLIHALELNLQRREQSLVFINRRGFAPTLYCSACGWIAPCHRCSARLTVHLARQKLSCHYCGHEERIPTACPVCGNQDLAALGHGTQRIEQAIAARFPNARVVRIDRDSTRRRDAFQSLREKVASEAVDILVGTQMLAKGHDFPNLTLVGVIGADQGLLAADFRAEERLFSQLLQVVGRAGRGAKPGRALVQTAFPHHPLFEALQTQDFDAFARAQLALREASGFPPFLYQALVRAEATAEAAVSRFLAEAARLGQRIAPKNVVVYDAAPAAMARIAGKWRWNLLVQSQGRAALHAFLKQWLPQLQSTRVRWSIDIDPLEL